MANSHTGAGHELYLMTHLGIFILPIMKTSTYYTFLEAIGLGQYNETISKMFQKCFKDFFVTSVNIELLRMKILDVTYIYIYLISTLVWWDHLLTAMPVTVSFPVPGLC